MQEQCWHRDEYGRLVDPGVTLRFVGGSLHGASEKKPSVFSDGFEILSPHQAGPLCEEYKRDSATGDLKPVNTGIAWGKGLTCPDL